MTLRFNHLTMRYYNERKNNHAVVNRAERSVKTYAIRHKQSILRLTGF
jgi:outer membrane protein assembly factor BamD (BamD/ComL family)